MTLDQTVVKTGINEDEVLDYFLQVCGYYFILFSNHFIWLVNEKIIKFFFQILIDWFWSLYNVVVCKCPVVQASTRRPGWREGTGRISTVIRLSWRRCSSTSAHRRWSNILGPGMGHSLGPLKGAQAGPCQGHRPGIEGGASQGLFVMKERGGKKWRGKSNLQICVYIY